MFRDFLVTTLALLGLLLSAPWLGGTRLGQLALSLLWIGVLVSVVTLARPRTWERVAALLGGGLIALVQLLDRGGAHPLAEGLQLLGALWLLVLALRVLFRHLWQATEVSGNEILAAVSLMLLMALLWAAVYDGLSRLPLDPPAFAGLSPDTSARGFFQDSRSSELLYFSLVTLTTVGYGDILPVHPLARILAALEALSGQHYVAILVARLVTLHLAQRGAGAPPRAD
jgi:voltage-gated potassium channel